MPRPSQPIRLPTVPGPKSSLADRVRWLIDDYWSGNRKKCAEDLGTYDMNISRVATGTNNPGTDLLEKLSEKPFINTRWLLSGTGTPYLSAKEQYPISWTLPVVDELPTGIIQQPSMLLARRHKEIDVSNYATSRCWSQLTLRDELAHRPLYGLSVGDFLLWETNPAYWKDLKVFDKRPAIIADKSTKHPRVVVLDYHEETEDEPCCLYCDDLLKLTAGKPTAKLPLRPINRPDFTILNNTKSVLAIAILSSRDY